ncbi:MAG: S49 family peptidase, partial [Calditrichaeota bacterium]|nr:S49 family peptidase [Calditrichota bacterium]
WIDKDRNVVAVSMRGSMTYQKSRWFDPGRHSLIETLEWIETAKNDVSVSGIALNMSGFSSSLSLAWELGEKLKEFRATGKRVYMYVDRPNLLHMYLAAQADNVWMDPQGMVDMLGWVMGHTYHKGMLEKLGLGVEEWRYFEYKSAFETLARKDMSEKDREQRLALLNDVHTHWIKELAEGRGLTVDSLTLAMDSLGFLTAHEALLFRLVDDIGRWDDATDLVERWSGEKKSFIERDELSEREFADQSWGEYPKIAVVYALGVCDLDTGIRARYTSRLLRKLAKDDTYSAVVLRVDSPGGDGLASDWVAEQMRTVSEQKPMIVSQGRVAASGGYWISAPADRVFTSPFTITGSIGVIAGWLWNEGLTDKTGLTFDKVQVGRHADIGSGIVLPLLGVEIPDRPIYDDERVRVEKIILGHYDDFVGMVAEDRGLSREEIESVAQGRVWSGPAAIEHKLVDEIGGLEAAVDYAREQASISKREKVELVEFPRPGLINFNRLFAPATPLGRVAMMLGLGGSVLEQPVEELPYELQVMQRYAKYPGQPQFMLPPESDVGE